VVALSLVLLPVRSMPLPALVWRCGYSLKCGWLTRLLAHVHGVLSGWLIDGAGSAHSDLSTSSRL
jgi:uncharacterized membrane protein